MQPRRDSKDDKVLGSQDEAFARLAVELSVTESVDQTASQIVAFAMETIGTQFAGITMIRGRGRFETLGASSALVGQADTLQYEFTEGPIIDANTAGQVVLSANLAVDRRWPRWAPAAAGLGFLSVLSADLRAGVHRIGSINLYGDSIRQFSDHEADLARLFAQHSAAALASVELRVGLQNALDTRTLVGQAQGILMERFDVSPDRAFAILRRYSQAQNIKLTKVAQSLVDRSELPTLENTDGEPAG